MKLTVYGVDAVKYYSNLIYFKNGELESNPTFQKEFKYENIYLKNGDKISRISEYKSFDRPCKENFVGKITTPENRELLLFGSNSYPNGIPHYDKVGVEYYGIFFKKGESLSDCYWYVLKKHSVIEDMFELGRKYPLYPMVINDEYVYPPVEEEPKEKKYIQSVYSSSSQPVQMSLFG